MFFVTTNTKNRVPVFADDAYAREAIEVLYRVQELRPFFIHGFVIMPDHCHLLLFVDEHGSIATIINRYKMGVAHSVGLGPIWQPRFHMRIVKNASAALHYIHQNPVEAGFVTTPEQYPWSSASGKWDVTGVDEL